MFASQAAIQSAGDVYNTAQSRANAKATNKYQQQVYSENARLATEAANMQYDALGARQVQETLAATQSVTEVHRQALEAKGRVRTSAADAGVSGASVDALYSDFERQELDYQTASKRNQAFRDEQFDLERKAVRSGLQSRIASAQPSPVTVPSWFGAFLKIGANVQQSFNDHSTYNANTGSYQLG
jgi:hypothetical protein